MVQSANQVDLDLRSSTNCVLLFVGFIVNFIHATNTWAQLRIARLQAPLRGKDKVIIHSPQSSPVSLEVGTTNVNEGTKNVHETHNLQSDQGADEF